MEKQLDPEDILEFERYPENHHKMIREYLKSLSELDVIALEIAQQDLGSSFNLLKSIGFQKWLKNKL